jgi:hypothetical protein
MRNTVLIPSIPAVDPLARKHNGTYEKKARMRVASLLCGMLLFLSLGVACAQTQPDDNRSLGDIAREVREQRRVKPPGTSERSVVIQELVADMSVNDPEEYRRTNDRPA